MAQDSSDVLARIDREKETYLEELKDYIRIPSISTDPAYGDEVLRCAEFALARMREAGLTAELVETEGYPLVYGEWVGAPGQPTILFYGHYDVQPADPVEEWRHDPFEPTEEGDELVARGATDDKGQSYAQLKGVAATLAERGALPVNVKFILEGEEESGGEAIDAYVRRDAGSKLGCDAVVISDSSMFGPGQPSLLYGLKGLQYMEIRVTGPDHDLHSGTFGGAVANPGNALAHIISRLTDAETGRILIPGFYDDVVALEDWEREDWRKLPHDEEAYKAELGISEVFGEEGYSTLERAWARPTCDVNGLWGGYQGDGAKTVLPSTAGAKVSMRLVPRQDPKKIAHQFREYVESVTPAGVTVEVRNLHGADPVLVDIGGELAAAATEAQEDVWGKPPFKIREGGSIPIVATFAQVLEVPILLMGFGLPDDRLHSPNEKFNISHFYNGIRTVVRLLDRAARGVSRERELKIQVQDPAALRRRLEACGAKRLHEESFEDNLVWDRDGELRAAGCLLRLRLDGHGARLTFKGPPTFEGPLKVRDEHETAVSDGESLEALLAALGYRVARRYQKYREEWRLDDVVIAVDRTPMGHFVEFEGAHAVAVAERCGCSPGVAVQADYLSLYEAYRGRHPAAPADMVFVSEGPGDE